MYKFGVSIETIGDTAVISYFGRLVPAPGTQIFQAAWEAYRANQKVVIKLDGVEFMDSLCLGQLIMFAAEMRDKKPLRVICNNRRRRELFKMTGFDMIAQILTNMDEAKLVLQS